MDIFIAIGLGIFIGTFFTSFVLGSSIVRRENEAYMEGFVAGQKDKEKQYEI